MSHVRENFINVIESLPYDLQEEIYKRKTIDILKDITQKYIEIYGYADLSVEDRDLIHNILDDNFSTFENLSK